MILDNIIADIIRKYGIADVLAALCRFCNDKSMTILFRKLNRVYEWHVLSRDKAKDRALKRQRGWNQ